MAPQMAPHRTGLPRPVSEPLSDNASANAIEMPAPIEAASPTRNVGQLVRVANAAANSGASVDTDGGRSQSGARGPVYRLSEVHGA